MKNILDKILPHRGLFVELDIQRFASGTISLGQSSTMIGQITWSSTTDTSANTSTVTINVQVKKSSSTSTATTGTWTGSYTIGSTTGSISYYGSIGTSYVTVATASAIIKHNDDGTGTCYIYAKVTGPGSTTLSGVSVSGSSTVTLDTIPRYTSISSLTLSNKTETSVTYSVTFNDKVSSIRYGTSTSSYSTKTINSTSTTFTISSLSANTSYTIYVMPCRYDSGLWGDGSSSTWKSASVTTYKYPYITSAPTIKIDSSSATGSFTLYNPIPRTCTIKLYDNTGTQFYSGTTSSTSFTFTSSDSINSQLLNTIPSASSGTYTATCTYSSSSKSVTGSYVASSSYYTPTATFTFADVNETTTAVTQDDSQIVRYMSTLRITPTITNYYGTTTKSVVLTCGTTSKTLDSSGYFDITIADTTSITIKVTDNRDISKTYTLSSSSDYTLIDYQKLTFYSPAIARTAPTEDTIKLDSTGLWFNGALGATTNALTFEYRYKVYNSSDDYSEWATLDVTSTDNKFEVSATLEDGYDYQKSYTFQLRITDALASLILTDLVVTKGIPIIYWNETQFGVTGTLVLNDVEIGVEVVDEW